MSDEWMASLIEGADGDYHDDIDMFVSANTTGSESAVVVFSPPDDGIEQEIAYVVAWQRADAPHKVKIDNNGWVIRHPLSCRPNLFDCIYNDVGWAERPAPSGIYPVTIGPGPGDVVLGERCTD